MRACAHVCLRSGNRLLRIYSLENVSLNFALQATKSRNRGSVFDCKVRKGTSEGGRIGRERTDSSLTQTETELGWQANSAFRKRRLRSVRYHGKELWKEGRGDEPAHPSSPMVISPWYHPRMSVHFSPARCCPKVNQRVQSNQRIALKRQEISEGKRGRGKEKRTLPTSILFLPSPVPLQRTTAQPSGCSSSPIRTHPAQFMWSQ